uniref:SAP domain-containing protein n=1 Tax=viral metagenome TaxID=1070528 RepID=A0A6C0EA11_9ZZZZ
MDDIRKYILSDKNLGMISQKMIEYTELDDTSNNRKSCKKWVGGVMQQILKANKIPSRGNKKDIIKKINIACLKNSVDLYKKKQKGRKRQQDYPAYSMDSGGGYAPIASGEGSFIAADGSMGRQMFLGNMNNLLQTGNKKEIASLLEQKALERSQEYDGGGDFMGGGMGMNNMGMGGMGGGYEDRMSMGFTVPQNHRNRPPEINFALDGSDTRGISLDPQMSGLDGMGGMNPMAMGGMGMNPMMMGGMNNMGMNPMAMGMNNMGMGMNNMGMGGMEGMDSNYGKMSQQEMAMRMNQEMSNRGMGQMNMNPMGGMGGGMNNGMDNNQMQMMMQFMQMMNNGNQHFHKGGGGADDDLMSELNELKIQAAKENGIDPQKIMHMTTEEIEEYIKKKAKKIKKNKKYASDTEKSEKSDSETDRKLADREELLKKLQKLKENTKTKKKHLDKAVKEAKKKMKKKSKNSDDSDNSDKSEESNKETETEKSSESEKSEASSENKKRKHKKNSKNKSDSDKSEEQEKKKQKIVMKVKPNSEENFIDYNDYGFAFKSNGYNNIYKNITNLKVTDGNFPKFVPKITSDTTKLCFSIDDEKTILELDEDEDYGLDELINLINDYLTSESTNIECKVDNKGRVIFQHKEGKNFDILCDDNSFAKLLGFTKETYTGKSKYVSEESNKFEIKFIYLYIENITKQEPIAKIDKDGNIIQMYTIKTPIEKLKSFVIKFKRNITEADDLYNFFGNTHSFNVSFEADK